MTTHSVYLDSSATTPTADAVMEAMAPYWQNAFGNPSSPHHLGVEAEKALNGCRRYLSDKLGVAAEELYFTGSGTESNNLAIQGLARSMRPAHLITTSIEHPSVHRVTEYLRTEQNWEVSYLPVDSRGRLAIERFTEALRDDTRLVSMMLVNNELGSVLPIQDIGQIISRENRRRPHPIVFHVDAVQALGHVPMAIQPWNIDLLTLSAHKIEGPKGVGLLYCRDGVPMKPLLFGGDQEHGLRSGTENVPGIVGLTKAVQLALEGYGQNRRTLEKLRGQLLTELALLEGVQINSPDDGACHIVHLTLLGIPAEVLVHYLEQVDVYVSMGAACSTKKQGVSHVLQAIGLSSEQAKSSIRLSLAPNLSEHQITYAVQQLKEAVNELRSLYGR